jgi:hypothetical protein
MLGALGGSAQDTLSVERLEFRLLGEEQGAFVPLIDPSQATMAGLFLPCGTASMYRVCSGVPFELWADGRLINKVSKPGCLVFDGYDFCEIMTRDTVFVSFVSKSDLKGLTVRRIEIQEKQTGKDSFLLLYKEKSRVQGWIVALLIVGVLFVLFKELIPLGYRNLFLLSRRDSGSATAFSRFLSLDNLFSILFASLLTGFAWNYLQHDRLFVWDWLVAAFWVLVLFLLKFSVVSLVSGLYRFQPTSRWQLDTFLRFFLVASALFALFAAFDFLVLNGSPGLQTALRWLAPLSLALYLVWVVFRMMLQATLKKLHIFSYLCGTEIVPTISLIYWLLDS